MSKININILNRNKQIQIPELPFFTLVENTDLWYFFRNEDTDKICAVNINTGENHQLFNDFEDIELEKNEQVVSVDLHVSFD